MTYSLSTPVEALSVREHLRLATWDAHERLHGISPFARLLRGELDDRGYRMLLMSLYGFYAPLEEQIRGAPAAASCGIDVGERRKIPLLIADLRHLGISEPAIRLLGRCERLPRLDSPSQVMGCLYVVEGSTLGGRVLARRLDMLLGPGKEGRRFFLAHGDLCSLMWRRFCDVLETYRAPGQREAMAETASQTFAALETWLRSR
jgi:heme oxygenase